MKRIIVDYSKLTNEILTLLVERFPDGYDDSNIIRFRNAQNELIEAVEVCTEETIYLVKVSTKLASQMENFDEDDDIDNDIEDDDVVEPIDPIKEIGIDEEDEDAIDDDEEEVDLKKDPGGSDSEDYDDDDDDDDDDDQRDSRSADSDDDDEEEEY